MNMHMCNLALTWLVTKSDITFTFTLNKFLSYIILDKILIRKDESIYLTIKKRMDKYVNIFQNWEKSDFI